MKLRISSCNTALKKDITRFAPLWGIYLVGGLLVMLSAVNATRPDVNARELGQTLGGFSVINLIYAGLCAQLLFGDLFNARLCNALHAMPMKRQDWFFSHLLAGLLFSLVPNTLGVLCLLPRLGAYWLAGVFWLLGMTLHFLFFYGLAVFSVMCTGNRFAMVVVYTICNFLSLLILWFLKTIYEPLLFGITLSGEIFELLSPVSYLSLITDLLVFSRDAGIWTFTGLSSDWIYLAVIAAVGILLTLLALVLYRRRALECAGDFIAVRPLRPVFLAIYTLAFAAVFAMFGELFVADHTVFFFVGFILGFFTGQMLLRRTVKVFRLKSILLCIGFGLLLIASLVLTWLDPLGVTRWIPQKDQVESVAIKQPYTPYDALVISDPEDIADVLELHKKVVTHGPVTEGATYMLQLEYRLAGGLVVTREYAALQSHVFDALKEHLSTPEYLFGYTDYQTFRDSVESIRINGAKLKQADSVDLLDALVQDCRDGKLIQYFGPMSSDDLVYLTVATKENECAIRVFQHSTASAAWLKENFALWAPSGTKLSDYFYDPF